MTQTTITPERLAALNSRVNENFSGSTIRKATTALLMRANSSRSAYDTYHGVAQRFLYTELRAETLESLPQNEADAIVEGFLNSTDEEIKALASQY